MPLYKLTTVKLPFTYYDNPPILTIMYDENRGLGKVVISFGFDSASQKAANAQRIEEFKQKLGQYSSLFPNWEYRGSMTQYVNPYESKESVVVSNWEMKKADLKEIKNDISQAVAHFILEEQVSHISMDYLGEFSLFTTLETAALYALTDSSGTWFWLYADLFMPKSMTNEIEDALMKFQNINNPVSTDLAGIIAFEAKKTDEDGKKEVYVDCKHVLSNLYPKGGKINKLVNQMSSGFLLAQIPVPEYGSGRLIDLNTTYDDATGQYNVELKFDWAANKEKTAKEILNELNNGTIRPTFVYVSNKQCISFDAGFADRVQFLVTLNLIVRVLLVSFGKGSNSEIINQVTINAGEEIKGFGYYSLNSIYAVYTINHNLKKQLVNYIYIPDITISDEDLDYLQNQIALFPTVRTVKKNLQLRALEIEIFGSFDAFEKGLASLMKGFTGRGNSNIPSGKRKNVTKGKKTGTKKIPKQNPFVTIKDGADKYLAEKGFTSPSFDQLKVTELFLNADNYIREDLIADNEFAEIETEGLTYFLISTTSQNVIIDRVVSIDNDSLLEYSSTSVRKTDIVTKKYEDFISKEALGLRFRNASLLDGAVMPLTENDCKALTAGDIIVIMDASGLRMNIQQVKSLEPERINTIRLNRGNMPGQASNDDILRIDEVTDTLYGGENIVILLYKKNVIEENENLRNLLGIVEAASKSTRSMTEAENPFNLPEDILATLRSMNLLYMGSEVTTNVIENLKPGDKVILRLDENTTAIYSIDQSETKDWIVYLSTSQDAYADVTKTEIRNFVHWMSKSTKIIYVFKSPIVHSTDGNINNVNWDKYLKEFERGDIVFTTEFYGRISQGISIERGFLSEYKDFVVKTKGNKKVDLWKIVDLMDNGKGLFYIVPLQKLNSDTQSKVTKKEVPDSMSILSKEIADLLMIKNMVSPFDIEDMIEISQRIHEKQEQLNLLNSQELSATKPIPELIDSFFEQATSPLQNRYNDIYRESEEQVIFYAPDGSPSIYSYALSSKIRSNEFVKWFGNYELSYSYHMEDIPVDCSKVLTPSFEPLVVWHGTGVEFSYFKFDQFPVAYFAVNRHYAEWFAEQKGEDSGYVLPFFLRIKNPLDLTHYGINKVRPKDFFDYLYVVTGMDGTQLGANPVFLDSKTPELEVWVYLRQSPKMLQKLAESKIFDGIHFYENNPAVPVSANNYQTEVWIAFEANQIKLAANDRGEILLASLKSFLLEKGGQV